MKKPVVRTRLSRLPHETVATFAERQIEFDLVTAYSTAYAENLKKMGKTPDQFIAQFQRNQLLRPGLRAEDILGPCEIQRPASRRFAETPQPKEIAAWATSPSNAAMLQLIDLTPEEFIRQASAKSGSMPTPMPI